MLGDRRWIEWEEGLKEGAAVRTGWAAKREACAGAMREAAGAKKRAARRGCLATRGPGYKL